MRLKRRKTPTSYPHHLRSNPAGSFQAAISLHKVQYTLEAAELRLADQVKQCVARAVCGFQPGNDSSGICCEGSKPAIVCEQSAAVSERKLPSACLSQG